VHSSPARKWLSRSRSFVNVASLAVNHGGAAVVAVPGVRLTTVATDIHPTSFEHICARIVVNKSSSIVIVIYRPGLEAIQSAFFYELGDLLECIATFAEPIYIVGDFNVRLDRADVTHASQLLDLLNSYGVDLRVNGLTHRLGGLLDVVATRSDLTPPIVEIMDVELSDHHLLQWSVPTSRVVVAIYLYCWATPLEILGY
jgi:hypothetical protein